MVEGPWDGRNKFCSVRQATLSLCRICMCKSTKASRRKGFFLEWMPKIFFSSCLTWKKILLGIEVATAYQVKTKQRLWIIWGSSSYMTYITPCRNVFKECDKQTIKWGIPVTNILNTCTRQSNKHLFETSCTNNKSFDQSYSAWNWRNELLGHSDM